MFHNIHLSDLPPEGKEFDGELRNDVFQLPSEDAPRYVPPVTFSVNVKLDGPDVVVEGTVHTRFELECARCGQWFPWEVDLENYYSQEPREGAATLDLTSQIREDILLALPGYPRCDQSNVEARTCPAADKFASESEYQALDETETEDPQHRDVWGALDSIQPPSGAPGRPKS